MPKPHLVASALNNDYAFALYTSAIEGFTTEKLTDDDARLAKHIRRGGRNGNQRFALDLIRKELRRRIDAELKTENEANPEGRFFVG